MAGAEEFHAAPLGGGEGGSAWEASEHSRSRAVSRCSSRRRRRCSTREQGSRLWDQGRLPSAVTAPGSLTRAERRCLPQPSRGSQTGWLCTSAVHISISEQSRLSAQIRTHPVYSSKKQLNPMALIFQNDRGTLPHDYRRDWFQLLELRWSTPSSSVKGHPVQSTQPREAKHRKSA